MSVRLIEEMAILARIVEVAPPLPVKVTKLDAVLIMIYNNADKAKAWLCVLRYEQVMFVSA